MAEVEASSALPMIRRGALPQRTMFGNQSAAAGKKTMLSHCSMGIGAIRFRQEQLYAKYCQAAFHAGTQRQGFGYGG
jgi:hypothetical protein